MTLPKDDFLICSQLMRHPLLELFHLSNLFQMPTNHRAVGVEFFSNVNCSQLVVVNFRWLVTTLLIFKGLISFAKLLKPSLHISSSWAKALLMLRVVPTLLQPILNLNKKIAQICFLFNIISLV